MKIFNFYVVELILLLSFFFRLNRYPVEGQVALSRHWLRGKFSGQKKEMTLVKIADGETDAMSGFGSDYGSGGVGESYKSLYGPGFPEDPSAAVKQRRAKLQKRLAKLLKNHHHLDDLEDETRISEANRIKIRDQNPLEKNSKGLRLDEDYPNLNSLFYLNKPYGTLCRAVVIQAIDSWSKSNSCDCPTQFKT